MVMKVLVRPCVGNRQATGSSRRLRSADVTGVRFEGLALTRAALPEPAFDYFKWRRT